MNPEVVSAGYITHKTLRRKHRRAKERSHRQRNAVLPQHERLWICDVTFGQSYRPNRSVLRSVRCFVDSAIRVHDVVIAEREHPARVCLERGHEPREKLPVPHIVVVHDGDVFSPRVGQAARTLNATPSDVGFGCSEYADVRRQARCARRARPESSAMTIS